MKINPEFYRWLKEISEFQPFLDTLSITTNAEQQQKNIELALRFFVVKKIPYQSKLDVNEYLDEGSVFLATTTTGINFQEEEQHFQKTFSLIDEALNENAFRKYNGERFQGGFLISAFEALSNGVSLNLDAILLLGETASRDLVVERTQALWFSPEFKEFTRAGVRGTTRLKNLIPFSKIHFKP